MTESGLSPELENIVQSIIDQQVSQYTNKIADLERENEILRQSNQITADNNNYQEKYYSEQQQNSKLVEANRTLENKLKQAQDQVQKLEARAAKDNQDLTLNVAGIKAKDDQIAELKKKVNELQVSIDKNHKDLIKDHGDIRAKDHMIAAVRQKNDELIQALDAMSQNYEIIKQEFILRGDTLSEYEAKIEKLQTALKNSSHKEKSGDFTDNSSKPIGPSTLNTTILADDPAEVQKIKQKNRKLKQRLLELEETERSLERLQIAFDKRNQQIDALNTELDKMQMEMEKNRITIEKSVNETEYYRDQFKKAQIDLTSENEKLKAKCEFLEEQNKEFYQVKNGNDDEKRERSKEIEELRKQLEMYESGSFGLQQAVNTTKELKAQLDVRDNHIATLVNQLNTMDKILNGLVKQVKPDFNIDEFLKRMEKEDDNDEKRRIEKAMAELNAKMELMRQREPLSQIHVDIADDENLVYAAPSRRKLKHKESINQDKENHIPKSLRKSLRKNDFKIQDETATLDLSEIPNGQELNATSLKSKFKTIGLQTEDIFNDIENLEFGDKDEWVRNLQLKLIKAQKENTEMKKQNNELSIENGNLQIEIEDLKNQLLDHVNPNQSGNIHKEVNFLPQSMEPTSNEQNEKPKLNTVAEQSSIPFLPALDQKKLIQLEISKKPNAFHLASAVGPEVQYKEEGVMMPSEEEREILEAKKENLEQERNRLQTSLSKAEQEIDMLNQRLAQRNQAIGEQDILIDELKKKLQEEKDKFKERLLSMQNEADLYIKKRILEIEDLQNVQQKAKIENYDDSALEQIQKRLQELAAEKSRLLNELNEAKISAGMAQRDATIYRDKLRDLQNELSRLQEAGIQNSGKKDLQAFNTRLTMKLKKLEKKCQDLEEENNDLKKFKQTRAPGDNLMSSIRSQPEEHAIDGEASSTSKQIKQTQARISRLQVENEELELRLAKANATIERLNQLLQRKETQLTKLQERTAKQIQAKEKEIIRKTSK